MHVCICTHAYILVYTAWSEVKDPTPRLPSSSSMARRRISYSAYGRSPIQTPLSLCASIHGHAHALFPRKGTARDTDASFPRPRGTGG